MTLLFDIAAAQPQAVGAHGGSEYAKSVLQCLLAERPSSPLIGFFDPSRPLGSELSDLIGNRLALHPVRNSNELNKLLHLLRPRRFFSALPYYYSDVDFGETEVVATIHGLRTIELPADFLAGKYADNASDLLKSWIRLAFRAPYRRWQERGFRRLVAIVARHRTFVVPSDYTRCSLLRCCPDLSPDQVITLYSPTTALSDNPAARVEYPQSLGLHPRQYLLIVSSNRWIKNSYRALAAIETAYQHLPPNRRWPVVVVGGLPRRFPKRWNHLVLPLADLRTEQLAALYKFAAALVYPSLNEGFGYPPIEAMSYGTPVLAAGISAISEIAGEGAAYFCPYDVSDIAIRLQAILSTEALSELSHAAKARFVSVSARQATDLRCLSSLLLRDL